MTEPPALQPPQSPRPGCISYALLILFGLWLLVLAPLAQLIVWGVDQFTVYENNPLPWYAWPLIAWGSALILALPIVPLALFTRVPRHRAIYRTWAIAIAFNALLGIARVFPATHSQPAALLQVLLTLAATGLLLRRTRHSQPASRAAGSARSATLLAVALAPIGALPWLLWGALGSWLDTFLALCLALSFGMFAGLLLDRRLLRPLSAQPPTARLEIFGHGLVIGITLAMLAAGFGAGGSQLLLLLVLPPLGALIAALYRLERAEGRLSARTTALLLALAVAPPLLLIDPDELSITLGDADILFWAGRAASMTLALALTSGALLFLIGNGLSRPPRVALSAGAAAVTWLLALLLFLLAGCPGFYGEQIFVILREQADLRPAAAIAAPDARAAFVYTTMTQHANRTQTGLRELLDTLRVPYQPYYLVNALEVDGGPLLRAYLDTRPEVERILDSPRLRPLPVLPPVSTGSQPKPTTPPWNITQIGADRVWSELGVRGKGIVVGQSDSGVDGGHPALSETYRGRGGHDDYNWLDPWNKTLVPSDIGGHGTHTLGSILGRDGIGVAPDAEWFGCVNLARNLGNPALYLNCMQFMLAPFPRNGNPLTDGNPLRHAHVINDSWGCPPVEGCDPGSLAPAASALRAAGVFVVVSAGNSGPRCGSVDSPLALYADVFSVGAIDRNGELATFSSRGPVTADGSNRVKPDIIAPGVSVLSSFPGAGYELQQGTSMAGPHVAGVVALMWSAQPKLIGNIDRTTQLLTQTAAPFRGHPAQSCAGTELPNNDIGYGVLDAFAAVKAAMAEK